MIVNKVELELSIEQYEELCFVVSRLGEHESFKTYLFGFAYQYNSELIDGFLSVINYEMNVVLYTIPSHSITLFLV